MLFLALVAATLRSTSMVVKNLVFLVLFSLSCAAPGLSDGSLYADAKEPLALVVETEALSMDRGEVATVAAHTVDAYGQEVASTNEVSWTSLNPEVVAVQAGGAVIAQQPGDTIITATSGQLSDRIALRTLSRWTMGG